MSTPPNLATADNKDGPDAALHAQGMQAVNAQDFEGGIEFFRKALHHNNERADTHFMLGVCYSTVGKTDEAIDHFQIAGVLAPTYTECWINLARVRAKAGRYREALSAVRQARKYAENPNERELVELLLQCIAPMETFDINPQIVEEVTCCFQNAEVPSERLIHTAQKLLLHQPVVKTLIEHYSPSGIRDFNALLADQSLNWPVLNHPLFIRLMSDHLSWHKDLEDVFHGLRSHFLKNAAKAPLSDVTLWSNALHFVAALAQQCFIGEYIYDTKDKEKTQLTALEKRIAASADPYDIALLACFKPLHELNCAQELIQNEQLQNIEPVAGLLRTQIAEPAQEKEILETLETFTSIDDEISLLVKEQYETFPYPRWVSTAIEKSATLRHILRFQFPHMDDADLPADDLKPEILIAGCGTGKQSIGNALLLPDAQFTAVDITAASLAYAQRKTNEMGLKNLRYGLGDILKLAELNKTFDSIQCGGVLHHMRDPMEGWRVLESILKPGGVMIIALYSEIARRSVVAARQYIYQQGLDDTAEGIREMREHIKGLPESHPMKSLMAYRDFYSLSELRDLIFHVQEHRFTALDLKKSIESLGLKFLGFQKPLPPNVLQAYLAMFPNDPYALDLENWHEFELKNPTIFGGMYQFWLQKQKS